MKRRLIGLLLVLVGLSACTSSGLSKDRSVSELNNLVGVDKIKIQVLKRDSTGNWIEDFTKLIDNPEQIEVISNEFQKHSDHWQIGYFPYLPGRLTVTFYQGDELVIAIMVVSRSNSDGSLSYFLSRPAGPAKPIQKSEFTKIMNLLGVDEDLANYDYSKTLNNSSQ